MKRPRESIPLFLVIALAGLGVFGWVMWQELDDGRTRVHYEDLALARLKNLAASEERFHEQSGRYGWVEDLHGSDLLGDVGVENDPSAGPTGSMYLTSPRYRLDILLPHMMTRNGQVVIALRSAGKRKLSLEEKHFVVVARPWGDALTGYRTFIIDETGRIYVSEGVSDETALANAALPELHPSLGGVVVTGGMRLYPLDDLPLR